MWVNHVGKDFGPVSKNFREKFPDFPKNTRICWACRRKQEEIDDYSTFGTSSQSVSFEDEQSSRLRQLEQLLSGLKEAYSNLPNNVPMRLRILTIAPSSWSIRQVAREFGASRHIAKKLKN